MKQWHKDMTGFRKGNLTILQLDHLDASREPFWLCQCSCGQQEIISHRRLQRKAKMCQYCISQKSSQLIDMIGKTSGYLTVLTRHGKSCDGTTWLCRCLCGKQTIVSGNALRRKTVRSCGCSRQIIAMGVVFKSYIEAFYYIQYVLAGKHFLHDKPYPDLGGKRFDFYLTNDNTYIEVTSFDKSFLNWRNYLRGVVMKRRKAGELGSRFVFIQRKCSPQEHALVAQYLDRRQELPPKAIAQEELRQQLVMNNRSIVALAKEYRTSPRRIRNLARKYGLQSMRQKKRLGVPEKGSLLPK